MVALAAGAFGAGAGALANGLGAPQLMFAVPGVPAAAAAAAAAAALRAARAAVWTMLVTNVDVWFLFSVTSPRVEEVLEYEHRNDVTFCLLAGQVQ